MGRRDEGEVTVILSNVCFHELFSIDGILSSDENLRMSRLEPYGMPDEK